MIRDIRFNGHIRLPVTLTPTAERYAVELSLLDLPSRDIPKSLKQILTAPLPNVRQ